MNNYSSRYLYPAILMVAAFARADAQTTTAAASPQARIRATVENSVARQRNSVALMQRSLADQRHASVHPMRAGSKETFFSLEPPVRSTSGSGVFACGALPAGQIESLVQDAAGHTALPPDLVRSVMKQESAFHPCAMSPKGAMGLMQLMPATAAQFGVEDPFNPKENVEGGARLLKQLMDYYGGNISLALSAYNAGPARVDAALGVPNIPETRNYVRQILALLPVDVADGSLQDAGQEP